MNAAEPFQLLPPLSEQEYAALRTDIAARGVLVPVVVDQHGRTLDGHHRRAIAAELHLACPTEVRGVADDAEAADLAVTLNCTRRHLSREQRRELIATEITRRPGDSDRAIARRVGCSPSTVGAARQVSNLDTLESRIGDGLEEIRRSLDEGMAKGVGPSVFATALRPRVLDPGIPADVRVEVAMVFAYAMDHLKSAHSTGRADGQPWDLESPEGMAFLTEWAT